MSLLASLARLLKIQQRSLLPQSYESMDVDEVCIAGELFINDGEEPRTVNDEVCPSQ